jgi:methyl-accepting chemotaxis protein
MADDVAETAAEVSTGVGDIADETDRQATMIEEIRAATERLAATAAGDDATPPGATGGDAADAAATDGGETADGRPR